MKWTRIAVRCKTEQIDTVSAVLSMTDSGLEIEDYSDAKENLSTVYGELIDEKILKSDKTHATVAIYISEEDDAAAAEAEIRERLDAAGLKDCPLTSAAVDEEDWANNWKQYYKPLRVGKRMLILPPWESCEIGKDDAVIVMDPGMAFGTGTHESTKLCLILLEKHLKPGEDLLDVGTGSGILSIAALKLGARSAHAYDIDPVAVKVAGENFEKNGVSDRAHAEISDLLRGVDRKNAPFSIVTANIVADILIRMAPEVASYMAPGARLVASGVIESRHGDVIDAMAAGGLLPIDSCDENDWTAIVFLKP